MPFCTYTLSLLIPSIHQLTCSIDSRRCIVTITTVGYGDHGIYPIEGMGRIVAAIAMISGILVIALPTSILGSNFQDVYSVHKRKKMMMVGQAKPSSLVTLRASVCELRSNRISLERTLKKARLHLSRVKTKEPTDTHQVWTTVDYSILRTLRELETYFSQFEDEEEEKGTSGRDLLFDERIHNDTNTGENGENDRADDSDTNDASDEEEDGFDADGNGNGNEVDGKLVPRSEYEILNSELRNAPTYSSIPVQTSKNEHGNN